MSKAKTGFKFLLILLLAGAAFYNFYFKPKMIQKAMAAQAAQRIAEVTVLKIKSEDVQMTVDLPGRVAAFRIAEVRPQVEGVIREIKFEQGSIVKKDQQLYQIDPRIYQSAFDSSSANLKAVRAKSERYKILLEQDAISKQEYDDMKAQLAAAEADFAKAKTNFSYSKVLAPISGYVGKSNITEGALVTANQADALTTIAQLDPIYVDMVWPTKDMLRIGEQKEIPVIIATDDAAYHNVGTLKFSEMFADPSTDSVRLRAIFSNKDQKLIPGMFVNGKLQLKSFRAITIPQRVTSRAPDGSLMIFIVDQNNVVKQKKIVADKIYKDRYIVTEGLEESEMVVYEGVQKIAEGATVKPVEIEIAGYGVVVATPTENQLKTDQQDDEEEEAEE